MGTEMMNFDRTTNGEILPEQPPFIWPDACILAGVAYYSEYPPGVGLITNADLISGVIVGASDATVRWIEQVLSRKEKCHVCLVFVLFPAGPTRAEHLKAINSLRAANDGGDVKVDVRLCPMTHIFDGDCERMTLPPTVVQAVNSATGRTVMSIGSVGDLGYDPLCLGSLNLVFHPDDAMRDAYRRWFQYLFSASAPLTPETCEIPHLTPAPGNPEAAELWDAFQLACSGHDAEPTKPAVDPETGEVTAEPNGEKAKPWDDGKTALDPLAQIFQAVYSSGWLVTIDEGTRIKPLAIPVKAKLLGQQAERMVGAIKQKQSFSLQVLDESVEKAVEKCRKVSDLMELLTYPLSQGNRWLPNAAKALLTKELEARNKKGAKVLGDALGGKDAESIKSLIERKKESIRHDLNKMYRELGQGDTVPEDKLNEVLDDVKTRLAVALNHRITPRAVYNRIGTPDLTSIAPDENWIQPLSLLFRSARILREFHTDPYFPRRFVGLSFSQDEFQKALDVFGDVMVSKSQIDRAREELLKLDAVMEEDIPTKQKCEKVWLLIHGKSV